MMNNSPLYEPELHVVGELTGADIPDSDNAFCSFRIVTDKEW
jgi:hypothetical protein